MFGRDTEMQSDKVWLTGVLLYCGIHPEHIPQSVTDIILTYKSANRHYHTFQHIRNMTGYWEMLLGDKQITKDATVDVLLAIIFHDFVYDTKWSKNASVEEASAQEFMAFCHRTKLDISQARVDSICNMIRSTATHTPTSNDYPILAFLDSDMFVLSLDRPQYIEYTKQVRNEWDHIDDMTYTRGRMTFLTDVLETPCIYFTENMIDREDIARENMRYELRMLDPANT